MNLKSYFPITEIFPGRTTSDWRQDIIAGITVAVMLVPQGMAYASLAGMPPIYGLYGGLIPLFIYAIFGTSRQMSIGPVAISALLVLAGVSELAEPFSPEFITLVLITGLLVGIVQVLLGLFRLGFLVNFISHPVIVGFTSAAAIIIAISQLKDLFGINIPRFSHSYETVEYAFSHLGEANWLTVVICIGSMAAILILKRIHRSIPAALIIVILGTLLVYFVGESTLGIAIVKDVPKGLPSFQIPQISLAQISELLPTILAVTIICIVESIAIARVLQAKHGDYQIRPNQELLALGLSKIAGGFFQSIPTSGSFTRSAVNNDAGAKSGFASIVTAFIIALTLIFLTPLFYFLPRAVLAAIVLLSVISLFDITEAKHLWKNYRQDFFMMLTTFIVTIAFGIEEGVLAGVVLSIAMVLFKSSRPHIAVLGKLPDSNSYRNIERFESVEQPEDILIIRFDNQVYYGNAAFFQDTIHQLVSDAKGKIKLLILDAGSIHEIDSTGFHALEDIYKYLKKNNIEFYISGMIGPVRDKAIQSGFIDKMGKKTQYLNINDAVSHYQHLDKGIEKGWSPDAIQTNVDLE
jgi:sulfate permease, SulP family